MQIKSGKEKEWNINKEINSHDHYSNAVISFAERWAGMMEASMKDGKTIDECGDATSHSADIEGITGFMYGCAVSLLVQVWEYGDELKKWHNGSYGLPEDANSVANPALLTISKTY